MKSDTSFCSCGDRGISLSFLGTKMSFMSIAWSHGLRTGMHSDSFFEKTLRYLWYALETRSSGFGLGFGTSDHSCSFLIAWMVLRPFWSSASMDCSRGDLPCKTLQVHGQWVILTWPVSQSMLGLWCFNYIYPRIIWCLPRSVISSTTFSRWPWKSMTISA